VKYVGDCSKSGVLGPQVADAIPIPNPIICVFAFYSMEHPTAKMMHQLLWNCDSDAI
jgi:hypothetical protein